jgi:hypothetical protein
MTHYTSERAAWEVIYMEPSYSTNSMRGLLPGFNSGEGIWKHEFAAGQFCLCGWTKK